MLCGHVGMTPVSGWALTLQTFLFSYSECGHLDTKAGAGSPWPLVMGLDSILPCQSKHCRCPWGSQPQRRYHNLKKKNFGYYTCTLCPLIGKHFTGLHLIKTDISLGHLPGNQFSLTTANRNAAA